MIPKELFQKVRRIEITTSRLVSDVFAGAYHSVFKGSGMEFDEVCEYQPGDDIRAIDWNVTARTGRPHIKKYIEERELTVMLLVDVSASCQFATVNNLKSKLAAEIAAILAFSAIRNNDKVGLIMFTDQIEKFIPPRKGLRHVLRVIREVLYFDPEGRHTDIALSLDYLNRVTPRKSVSFVISDFFEKGSLENLKKKLSVSNKRHDLVAITLNDPLEADLPNCGLVELKDAETGELCVLDTNNLKVRRQYGENAQKRMKERSDLFTSIGVDHVDISTDKPYAQELVKFFLKRQKRSRSS